MKILTYYLVITFVYVNIKYFWANSSRALVYKLILFWTELIWVMGGIVNFASMMYITYRINTSFKKHGIAKMPYEVTSTLKELLWDPHDVD